MRLLAVRRSSATGLLIRSSAPVTRSRLTAMTGGWRIVEACCCDLPNRSPVNRLVLNEAGV